MQYNWNHFFSFISTLQQILDDLVLIFFPNFSFIYLHTIISFETKHSWFQAKPYVIQRSKKR